MKGCQKTLQKNRKNYNIGRYLEQMMFCAKINGMKIKKPTKEEVKEFMSKGIHPNLAVLRMLTASNPKTKKKK